MNALGNGLKDLHMATILRVGNRELYREKPAMYLCNHRSWADFMIDHCVTEGRSLFMVRLAVLATFPIVMIPMWLMGNCIMFKRGKIDDKEAFNAWIDEKLAGSTQSAIGVFPEGHRSVKAESLPLKRGMIKYGYSRGHPVQCIITANKEAILTEKLCIARLRQTVAVGYSELVWPKDYPDFESFMAAVQKTWDDEWDEVFGADFENLEVLPEVEPQFDYPLKKRILMLLLTIFVLLLGAWSAVVTFKGVRTMMGWLGLLQWPVTVLFLVYVGTSFYVYSQPVSMVELRGSMLKQRKKKD